VGVTIAEILALRQYAVSVVGVDAAFSRVALAVVGNQQVLSAFGARRAEWFLRRLRPN